MKNAPSWIKSKTSLIKLLPLTILAALIGCSTEQTVRPRGPETTIREPSVTEESKLQEALPVYDIKAPWEILSESQEELKKLLTEKKIKEALLFLNEKKKNSPNLSVFFSQASLLLKLGRANEALRVVSEFVSLNQLRMEDIPAELSLVAAYAYKSQKDIDQTFAWFGVSLKNSYLGNSYLGNTSSIQAAQVAKLEVKNLLSRISDKIFSNYFIKWETDQSLSPLILEEQNRRRGGGSVVRLEEVDYFSAETYGYSTKELPKNALISPTDGVTEVIVLTPVKSSKVTDEQTKAAELALSAAIPPVAHQSVTNLTALAEHSYKVVINLGAKNLSPAPKGAVEISVNPRLAGTETSILPKLTEEVKELIKISESGYQCDETFVVADSEIGLPPTVIKTTLDALLASATAQTLSASPCLIGGFEIDDQVEKLTRIKARVPGLRLFGPSSWMDPALLQTYQGLFEGSVFITPFYLGSSRELVREFLSTFQNSAGIEGTYAAALAYDAARIAALILGNKQSESASYNLQSFNLQSVTGIESFVVSIDKTSGAKRVRISERRFIRLILKNGDLEELGSF